MLGETGGERVTVNGGAVDLGLAELTERFEGWLPKFMANAS